MNADSQTPLQIPYGELHGQLVAPDEAPRGLSDVRCLECGEALVAAQGDTIRPYFRHQSGIDHLCDYGGESIRHRLAKMALASRIRQALSDAVKLPIKWPCDCPKGRHTGNLMKGATSISVDDRRVGPFMPDIGIFDYDRCRVFVEIVQSHANTDDKVAYCKDNGISLVTITISQELDPVALVRRTPLIIECNVCSYRLGSVCHCGGDKLTKTDECISCLRSKRGIDIDIAGSYRAQQPRLGTWVAIVTDADGKELQYTGQDTGSESSQTKMLRGALAELEQNWKGTYQVRLHSLGELMETGQAKQIFAGRSIFNRHWRSIKDNGGKGNPQPERVGRLVEDRPTLARAVHIAQNQLRANSRTEHPTPN